MASPIEFSQACPLRVVNIVWKYCYPARLVSGCKILICFYLFASFKESLPSSLLAAMFGQSLFTPKDCLQRKICFFNDAFFPGVEIILLVNSPYL